MGIRTTWTAIATCLSCLGATAPADAFGLLQAGAGTSEVRAHRIALAVSPDRTVLWDELSYTGAPGEFLWLLPVLPGTTFEVANPAWFDALEAVTRARVSAISPECVEIDAEGGCSCIDTRPQPMSSPDIYDQTVTVQILRTNTVGPYQTQLIRSSEPGALAEYIAESGQVVPLGFESTLEAYIDEGYDFLAVSLRPAAGVLDMKPIRVVTPGGVPILPIRMLALGAAPVVNVELYVIGETRYGLPELTEVILPPHGLTWDAATQSSNYEALESAALAVNDGLSFFTAFSSGNPFGIQHADAEGSVLRFQDSGSSTFYTLADLYFAQGRHEAPTATPSCPSIAAGFASDLEVTDVNPPGQGQLDDLLFACGPMLDLQQALIGMHPQRTWLTRLDLELRREMLVQDYLVEPQRSGATVSPIHVPARLTSAPPGCEQPIFRSSVAPRRVRPFGWATVPLLLLSMMLRRRLRRARGTT
jgi:hypothetical protein